MQYTGKSTLYTSFQWRWVSRNPDKITFLPHQCTSELESVCSYLTVANQVCKETQTQWDYKTQTQPESPRDNTFVYFSLLSLTSSSTLSIFLCPVSSTRRCLHIFLIMKGYLIIKREREKREAEKTKPASVCFLEKEWHPLWERACPAPHDKNAKSVSGLSVFTAPSLLFTAIMSPSIQANNRLSSSGIHSVKLLMIAAKKLKCFCSQDLLSEAYCAIVKRISSEDLNTWNNPSTKKHFRSILVCCGVRELRNQSNWNRPQNFLSAVVGNDKGESIFSGFIRTLQWNST